MLLRLNETMSLDYDDSWSTSEWRNSSVSELFEVKNVKLCEVFFTEIVPLFAFSSIKRHLYSTIPLHSTYYISPYWFEYFKYSSTA